MILMMMMMMVMMMQMMMQMKKGTFYNLPQHSNRHNFIPGMAC
jgi:hypothetical protein